MHTWVPAKTGALMQGPFCQQHTEVGLPVHTWVPAKPGDLTILIARPQLECVCMEALSIHESQDPYTHKACHPQHIINKLDSPLSPTLRARDFSSFQKSIGFNL